MLLNFDLLDLATQRRAVARAVLARDTDLDRALRLSVLAPAVHDDTQRAHAAIERGV